MEPPNPGLRVLQLRRPKTKLRPVRIILQHAREIPLLKSLARRRHTAGNKSHDFRVAIQQPRPLEIFGNQSSQAQARCLEPKHTVQSSKLFTFASASSSLLASLPPPRALSGLPPPLPPMIGAIC